MLQISEIHQLNGCKYSEVKVEAVKKVFVIVSRSNWCNEVIKVVFGVSAEARRNNSNVTAWAMPYSYTGSVDSRSRCLDNVYFDNASRPAYGLARVDLLCGKRRPRLGRHIWKRSIQENKQNEHHPFTVTIYGSNESLFTITVGVLFYAVFGMCFLVTNLAYLSGIYTVYNATLIPECTYVDTLRFALKVTASTVTAQVVQCKWWWWWWRMRLSTLALFFLSVSNIPLLRSIHVGFCEARNTLLHALLHLRHETECGDKLGFILLYKPCVQMEKNFGVNLTTFVSPSFLSCPSSAEAFPWHYAATVTLAVLVCSTFLEEGERSLKGKGADCVSGSEKAHWEFRIEVANDHTPLFAKSPHRPTNGGISPQNPQHPK
ncbi:unnamed protein product [Litomosoides sigmodontis]|uniref:Uncharacterized protein n=1 Tax=Litomosoides sigmodontis TaxID=42156 RepID=A0A3P6T4J4_LITSI|nr:unnamed protein product [Litomosoides sigmodontis]